MPCGNTLRSQFKYLGYSLIQRCSLRLSVAVCGTEYAAQNSRLGELRLNYQIWTALQGRPNIMSAQLFTNGTVQEVTCRTALQATAQ